MITKVLYHKIKVWFCDNLKLIFGAVVKLTCNDVDTERSTIDPVT